MTSQRRTLPFMALALLFGLRITLTLGHARIEDLQQRLRRPRGENADVATARGGT